MLGDQKKFFRTAGYRWNMGWEEKLSLEGRRKEYALVQKGPHTVTPLFAEGRITAHSSPVKAGGRTVFSEKKIIKGGNPQRVCSNFRKKKNNSTHK